jgi:alkanesulfonate monooxygenase SsuD/methylene tetrahydromethanopterin reductase-like flavin-dependent oxidoreductase (luciferase family)
VVEGGFGVVMERDLKIGVVMPGMLPAGEMIAYARLVEACGLDSVWLGDHFYFDLYGDLLEQGSRLADNMRGVYYRGHESLTMLAALAVATERVALGTLVACTGYRNPALLADIAETIDALSGGRLILGLGAGNAQSEHRIHGFPFDQRIGRFEEALRIIQPMLRGESVTFAGEFHRTNAAEVGIKGPRPGGPPLMIGALGGGPRMRRLVAERADIWNAWVAFGDSDAAAYGSISDAMDTACELHGRNPATLERNVTVDVAMPGAHTLVPTAKPLTGAPEEIDAGLAAYANHGVGHLSVVLTPNTAHAVESLARAREQLRG